LDIENGPTVTGKSFVAGKDFGVLTEQLFKPLLYPPDGLAKILLPGCPQPVRNRM
jgi:hypothetical protein